MASDMCLSGRPKEDKRVLLEGDGQTGYFVSEKEKHVFSYPVIVYSVNSRFDRLPENTDFLQSDMSRRLILCRVESRLTHAPLNLVVNVRDLHRQIPTHCAVTSVTRRVLDDFFQLLLQKFRALDNQSLGYVSFFLVDYFVHKLCVSLLH